MLVVIEFMVPPAGIIRSVGNPVIWRKAIEFVIIGMEAPASTSHVWFAVILVGRWVIKSLRGVAFKKLKPIRRSAAFASAVKSALIDITIQISSVGTVIEKSEPGAVPAV